MWDRESVIANSQREFRIDFLREVDILEKNIKIITRFNLCHIQK
jgi:hypothetical protein